VALLADDSPEVLAAVRTALAGGGRLALSALRRAAGSQDARLRARARALLADEERRTACRRLLGYALGEEIELERALFLLSRLDTGHRDSRPYVRALDAMGREVAARAEREENTVARPMVLAHYLGNELGFVGSEADFHHPDNIHLHRAIERKRGMPLTLAAIYLFVARRAGIRAAAVALPGHVIVRLYARRRSMLIDPFAGGRMLTRNDCISFLAEQQLVPRPEWFHDASDSVLFQRHVRNLMHSFQTRGLVGTSRDLHRVANVLERVHERPRATSRAS